MTYDQDDQVRRLGILIWTLVGGLILAGAVVWLLWRIQIIWLPVVFGFALVYVLNPFVTRLQERRIPRPLGAALGYAVFGGIVAVFVLIAAPVVSEQTEKLFEQIPVIVDDVVAWSELTLQSLGVDAQLLTYDELVARLGTQDAAIAEGITGLAGTVFSLLGSLAETAALLVVTPVIAFYLLIDAPRLGRTITELIPERHREEMVGLGHSISRALGGFVRGQLTVALIVALLAGTGLLILGVDLWLVLGIIAGFTNLIPFVGPWISGVLSTAVAFVLGDLRLALFVALLFIGVQQLDNHVISPLVLRATVKLHPALIILALLVGGSIAGVLGLLLAVPFTALIKVLVAHFWRTRILGQHWEEATQAYVVEYGPPPPDSIAGRLRGVADGAAGGRSRRIDGG